MEKELIMGIGAVVLICFGLLGLFFQSLAKEVKERSQSDTKKSGGSK